MVSRIFQTAFVASALLASANAHFSINTPQPIPGASTKDPLDPSGSNFPCHGSYSGGQKTSMAAGSSQPLLFELGGGANTAVHGGGSCQISISYETDAAKLKEPSNWKVIHSFIGGCPTNAKGNLPQAIKCTGSDSSNCVNQDLTFQIPNEVKSGDAILAWTWFNNVGNREMYMNCASVSITGGTGQLDSLPSLFTANIGNGCSTTETFNTDFPNPGKYVTTASTLNYPLKAPSGSCGSGSGSGSSSSSSSSSSSGSSSGSGSSGSSGSGSGTQTQAGTATAAPTANAGGVFAEGAGTATTLATVVAPAAHTNVVAAPAFVPGSASTSGSCAAGQVTCSNPGFYCIDDSTFGNCDFGCATPMKMAAGTACSNNAVVHAIKIGRRHNHRHMQRRRFVAGITV